jgi:hypothetical protein
MNSARHAVLVLLLAAGIALTGCGGTHPQHHGAVAEAAVTPKISPYRGARWRDLKRRPASIQLGGNLWPLAWRLRWSHWRNKNAKATGKVALYLGCKPPAATCRTTDRNVTVWAYTVRTRRGVAYPFFIRMTWRFNNAKKGATKARFVNRVYRLFWNNYGADWGGRSCYMGGVC